MNSSRHWNECWPDRRAVIRAVALVLALALAMAGPAPSIAQDACGDYAVAVAPQEPGRPLSENVISLVTSNDELAAGVFEEPLTVSPSPKSGVALVRSLGGIFALLDVVSGAITPLQIPEEDQRALSANSPTTQNAAVSEFMLLSGIPNAVWLVDLTTGDALDLTTLEDDGNRFIEAAEISPDGKWLIYFSQDEGFLISLETPGEPEPIDTEPLLPYPSFDLNSDVVYAVQGDLLVSIRSLDPATGARTELGVLGSARFLPLHQGPHLLIIDGSELLKLEAGASAPSPSSSGMTIPRPFSRTKLERMCSSMTPGKTPRDGTGSTSLTVRARS